VEEVISSRRSVVCNERKVIKVKRSEQIFVLVLVIALSGSAGFGAMLSNIDGLVNPDEYYAIVPDHDDLGTEAFVLTGSDIKDLYWGLVPDPMYPTDPDEAWYTLGMTVTAPPINTSGDGTLPFPTVTTFQLGIVQGGIQRYSFNVMMFYGNVVNLTMLEYDAAGLNPAPVVLDANTLQHAVDISGNPIGGLEIAIKSNKFTNLAESPFDVAGLFEGGGMDEDDVIAGRVPEPSTVSMIVLGGLLMLARRRRRKSA